MKKQKSLDVVFILDKSGSMNNNVENTITSFNEYLEKEKQSKFTTKITTVLFSDNYKYLHKNVDVKKVKPITNKEYYCYGCTALYDAIGSSINYIDNIKHDKVLFVIITDGYENASKEYKKEDITKMIKEHKSYEFIYIGADIDSYAAGSNIGIDKSRIANFKKDKKCSSMLFSAVDNFSSCIMEDKAPSSWKEELEEYIEENTK